MERSYKNSHQLPKEFCVLSCVFSALFLCACESVPRAQIDEANSLGDGKWRLEGAVTETSAISVSRGVGEDTDVGLQLDFDNIIGFVDDANILSAYAKYSFLNKTEGFSLAGLAGGFTGLQSDVDGYFLGPVLSWRSNNVLLSLRARYNKLTSRIDVEDLDSYEFFPSDEVAQSDASVRIFFSEDKFSIKFGYGCQHQLGAVPESVRLERVDDTDCSRSVAFTWYTK